MPYADKDVQRAYQRDWMAKRREEWFAAHGPCVDCGTWEDLTPDHTDPSQKVTHRVWSWSPKRRDAELAKCVVRCAPCHRERHIAPRRKSCGTQASYRRGCRCDACVEEMRRVWRIKSERKRARRRAKSLVRGLE